MRDAFVESTTRVVSMFKPPHHVAPPRLVESVFNLMVDGIVPVLTLPERLSWIDTHYEVFGCPVHGGALMQIRLAV